MLTRDRNALAQKAIDCFVRQTYPKDRRCLLIFDTNAEEMQVARLGEQIAHVLAPRMNGAPIGLLRNAANERISSDIIVHWDDDDWSHPERLQEQVQFLRVNAPEAECVGYNEMLFWRTEEKEAWLYTNLYSILGTSLCYWRKTWERRKFLDSFPQRARTDQPYDGRCEYENWKEAKQYKAVSAYTLDECNEHFFLQLRMLHMIARIHGNNSSNKYANMEAAPANWMRVPRWDAYCQEACG